MVQKSLLLLLAVGLILVVADDFEDLEEYGDTNVEGKQEFIPTIYSDAALLDLIREIVLLPSLYRENQMRSMSSSQYPKCLRRGAKCTKSEECCSHRCSRLLKNPFCF